MVEGFVNFVGLDGCIEVFPPVIEFSQRAGNGATRGNEALLMEDLLDGWRLEVGLCMLIMQGIVRLPNHTATIVRITHVKERRLTLELEFTITTIDISSEQSSHFFVPSYMWESGDYVLADFASTPDEAMIGDVGIRDFVTQLETIPNRKFPFWNDLPRKLNTLINQAKTTFSSIKQPWENRKKAWWSSWICF